MPNAAHELADLLENWMVIGRNATVRSSRGFQGDTTEDWRAQVRAAGLLREIDRYIEAMQQSGRTMEHFLRAYPNWAKGVFAPDNHWGSSSSGVTAVISQPSIDQLRALGDIIEATELTVSLSPVASREKISAIDDLLLLLDEPGVALSEVEKRYVYELANSIRRVFEESTILGAPNLLARVHELLGVMTMLAETLSREPDTKAVSKRILAAARRVVPYASIGARVSVGTLGAAADLVQITAGP